jgi:hypothetical protein
LKVGVYSLIKRLNINESVNLMSDLVYDNIALLGYACILASNDLHHIHLCAEGEKFQEIHEDADMYLSDVRDLNDFCLELAKEGNLSLYNETYALDVIKDSGNDWAVEEQESYNFREAFTAISNILTDLSQFITLVQDVDGITSDVSSELDTYLRKFTKAVNYFIAKKLENEEDVLIDTKESFNHHRMSNIHESCTDTIYTGCTWAELIKSIESCSDYIVDSSEKDIVGSRHNSILLHKYGNKNLFIGTVEKDSDGCYLLLDADIKPIRTNNSKISENYGTMSVKRFGEALGELVAEFLYDIGYDTSFNIDNKNITWTVNIDPTKTDERDFKLSVDAIKPTDNIRSLVKSLANRIRDFVESSNETSTVQLEKYIHMHESHKARKNRLYVKKIHKCMK